MKNNKNVKLITYTGVFAALICITTAFLFHIPIGVNNEYVHIGDAFIYLASCVLPMPYAMIAASVGGGLADLLTGAYVWVIPTMLIKPILVLFFTRKKRTFINTHNIIGIFLAGLAGHIGYAIANGILYGNFLAAFAVSLIGLVQPIGSAIAFVLIGYAFDKIKVTDKISTNIL